MWTFNLAVLRVVAIEAQCLETFGPAVPAQPSVHASPAFADLLTMLRAGATLDVVDGQKDRPALAAASTGFTVVSEGLEFDIEMIHLVSLPPTYVRPLWLVCLRYSNF